MRHHDVQDERVGTVVLDRFERLGAVDGKADLVALETERALQRLPHAPVVFGDQHSGAIAVCHRNPSLRSAKTVLPPVCEHAESEMRIA